MNTGEYATEQILRAYTFVAMCHKKQSYGNYSHLYHCSKVAQNTLRICKEKGRSQIQTLVTASILHDVLEDIDCTFEALKQATSYWVASVVSQVTKYPEDTIEQYYQKMDYDGIIVKVGDRIANLENMYMVDHSPKDTKWLFEKVLPRYTDEMKYYKEFPVVEDCLRRAHEEAEKLILSGRLI